MDWHPTKINLYIFDNHYVLRYSDPELIDREDYMISVLHKKVELRGNIHATKKVDTMQGNMMFLDP